MGGAHGEHSIGEEHKKRVCEAYREWDGSRWEWEEHNGKVCGA